jgi:hypothetical protein
VGDVTEFTLDGIVIDNSFFGVIAAVGEDGMEVWSPASGTIEINHLKFKKYPLVELFFLSVY